MKNKKGIAPQICCWKLTVKVDKLNKNVLEHQCIPDF